MKRLPPAKRNQLIGVAIATVGLICLIYFMLIAPQNANNRGLALEINKESGRLQQYKEIIKKKQETSEALTALTEQLSRSEQDIASGDLYAWTYETIRRFKTAYSKLDIPTSGQPTLGDCELITGFPYKQIRFTVTGSSFYHDLGKFVADFENKFPHCQVMNLSAEPIPSSEKLNFRLDIVALVKPNS